MDIKNVRQITGMSQRAFSSYFGIPLGTLRNWEQKIANPPEYVFNMIFTTIRRDKMINIETIRFMKDLDKLAELGKAGIRDFSESTHDIVHSMVFYDRESPDEHGWFPIVLDSCVIDDPECIHHDIISYYDSDASEYTIRVIIDDDGIPFIQVNLLISDEVIVIEDGRWYFA